MKIIMRDYSSLPFYAFSSTAHAQIGDPVNFLVLEPLHRIWKLGDSVSYPLDLSFLHVYIHGSNASRRQCHASFPDSSFPISLDLSASIKENNVRGGECNLLFFYIRRSYSNSKVISSCCRNDLDFVLCFTLMEWDSPQQTGPITSIMGDLFPFNLDIFKVPALGIELSGESGNYLLLLFLLFFLLLFLLSSFFQLFNFFQSSLQLLPEHFIVLFSPFEVIS